MRAISLLLSLAAIASAQCRYQFGRLCFTSPVGEVMAVTPAPVAVSGVSSPGKQPAKTLSAADFAAALQHLAVDVRQHRGRDALVLFDSSVPVEKLAAQMQVETMQLRTRTAARFRLGAAEFTGYGVVVVKPVRPLSDAEWSSIFGAGRERVQSPVADLLRRNNGLYLLRSSNGQDAFDLATELKVHPLLEFAEPDYVISVAPQSAGSSPRDFVMGTGVTASDSLLPHQWALRNGGSWADARGGVSLQNYWRIPDLSQRPVVAVVDDGVQPDHPDLAPQLLTPFDVTGSANILENGFQQYLFNDHGTRVAGIIAAVADNSFGIAGAAPFARILPIRAFFRPTASTSYRTFRASELAAALSYAAERASVINISWFYNDLKDIQDITEVLRQMPAKRGGRGVVVVASAGNFGSPIMFPASLSPEIPGLIAVGATDRSDSVKRCDAASSCAGDFDWGSGQGPALDVVAPGVDVLSTYPCAERTAPSCFARFDGTSAAAPFVSALAAHLLARNPALTSAEIKSIIRSTSDPLDWRIPNSWSGYGRISICRAVGGTACNVSDLAANGVLLSSAPTLAPPPRQPGKAPALED